MTPTNETTEATDDAAIRQHPTRSDVGEPAGTPEHHRAYPDEHGHDHDHDHDHEHDFVGGGGGPEGVHRADIGRNDPAEEPPVAGGPVTAAALWLIRGYQRWLSPGLPPACRFVPSCSQYGYEAIAKYGIITGGRLAAWRILRCNPFGGTGYDPVP